MKWRNRELIFGTAALTAIGLAGASVAAQGTEQVAQGTEQVAESDEAGVVEPVIEDDEDVVEAETELLRGRGDAGRRPPDRRAARRELQRRRD